MRSRSIARWVCPALVPMLVGCVGSRGDTDLLEARLRDQQDMVARYEKLLDSNQQELTLARKESDLLRTQIAAANASPLLPEHADVLLRAEQLAFHQMMTGTRDIDGHPGDEALNVVLMPQSRDGETIRLVGDLEIEALDLSKPEGQQRVGEWKYTPEQARELWHSGFLASGFQVDVPWNAAAAGPDVVLHARLKTADGRQFDASHQLRVDLPVMQTAAALPADAPQIEPRRMVATPPAQPIDVAQPLLANVGEAASIAADSPESRTPSVFPEATTTPPPVVPEQVAALEPLSRPLAVPVDESSAASPGEFPQSTEAGAFDSPTASVADVAPEAAAPFPGGQPAAIDPAMTATPFDQSSLRVVARPVAETPFEIQPREVPPPVQASAPVVLNQSIEPLPIAPDQPTPQVAAPFTPPEFPTAEPTQTAAVTPFDVLPREVPNPTAPAAAPPGAEGGPPSANGVTIQPLAPPQRYRRAASRAQLVPPPFDVPPPAVPVATPFDAPVTPPTSAAPASPPATPIPATVPQSDPAPFPVNVTKEPARPVIQSSVNWTDESIPYLR